MGGNESKLGASDTQDCNYVASRVTLFVAEIEQVVQ